MLQRDSIDSSRVVEAAHREMSQLMKARKISGIVSRMLERRGNMHQVRRLAQQLSRGMEVVGVEAGLEPRRMTIGRNGRWRI